MGKYELIEQIGFVQTQMEIVEEGIGILLLASAQMERGDDLGHWIDGQPEPLDAGSNLGMQLVQLDEGEDQALEVAVVQQHTVGAHALEPARDCRVGVACVANQDRNIDAFGHEPEHHLDAIGCCLQVIEWGVAATGEILAAVLTAEMLDVSLDAAFAVADEGVDLVISDAEVFA